MFLIFHHLLYLFSLQSNVFKDSFSVRGCAFWNPAVLKCCSQITETFSGFWEPKYQYLIIGLLMVEISIAHMKLQFFTTNDVLTFDCYLSYCGGCVNAEPNTTALYNLHGTQFCSKQEHLAYLIPCSYTLKRHFQ